MTDPNLPEKGVRLHKAPPSLALRALIARAAGNNTNSYVGSAKHFVHLEKTWKYSKYDTSHEYEYY